MASSPQSLIVEPSRIWRNGELVPFADATTHVLSHMSARGSQIFDVLLVVSGPNGPQAFGLREHVARFVQSAETMGMTNMPDVGAIESAVADTVRANLADSAIEPEKAAPMVVKLIAAWDGLANGVVPETTTPTIYVVVSPWTTDEDTAADPKLTGAPIKVKVAEMPKIPASILPPSMKVAAAYTPGLRHQLKAAAEGFDQVLFRTIDGDMAEGVTSSYFVVKNGRITVPPVDSVLDGITRRAALDAAQALGIPHRVQSVRWDEVTSADELLLTSTTNIVRPIEQLDDRLIPAPGPVTAKLADVMNAMLRSQHDLSSRWMTPLEPLLSN